jgi:hypothetical protein
MVHQYAHKDDLTVTLQLPKKDGIQRNAFFVGGEFITDDDGIATDIEATNSFKTGEIQKVIGEIKKASRKFVVTSGGRGTDPKTISKE